VTAFKPGLTVRAIRPVIAGLEALGHSVDSLLAEAGIPASTGAWRAVVSLPSGRGKGGCVLQL